MKKILLILLLSLPAYAFALDVRYCTGDSVRVRSDHSTSASILATMNKGTAFNIVGTSDKKETVQDKTDFWYTIVTENNVTGWVFGAFVSDSGKKSTAKSSGVIVGEKYMFTNTWLFPEPITDWKKPIKLQYHSKVEVTDKAEQMSSAMDHIGHWTKVRCGDITGWTLDSFLTKSDDFDLKNASMYNVCLFNDPQVMKLMEKECPDCGDILKSMNCYSAIDVRKTKFDPAPEFNYNDPIIILTKTEVTQDKIGKLKLALNEANGTSYMLFDTAKMAITYKEEKSIGLHINRTRFSKDIPVLLNNKIEPANQLYLDAVSFHLSQNPSRGYEGKSPALIKKDLKISYSIVCNAIESSDYPICEFKPVNKENTWENFIAIFNKDQLVYCNFSNIITFFRTSGRIYFSMNEWIPNTGCGGRKLLLLEDGIIKLILSQYYYAN